jgi:endonuclease-8
VPEGDTIAKAADALNRALAGRVIVRSDFRVPALATVDLAGQTITEVVSRGKHLLMRTNAGLTVHTHLKMEGAWRLLPGGRRPRDMRDAIRVVIETAACTAVASKLGIVELIPTAEEGRALGHLGPDVLGEDWNEAEALRRLGADPLRRLADALLDQSVMAGLGNVYKSEICFLRGVDPATPVGEVADLGAVVRLARRLLIANRTTGKQVTTGDPRRGRSHWVYGRGGQPCRRCGSTVRRRIEPGAEATAKGTGERVTYWCPACQPETGIVTRAEDRSQRPRSGNRSSPRARSHPPRR